MSDTKTLRRPTKRVLKALAKGLEEIKDHFVWEAFAEGNTVAVETHVVVDEDVDGSDPKLEPQEEDEETGGFDEEVYYPPSFDREDVEVAIDEFISELIRKNLISKTKSGRLPSLSRTMVILFGEDHPVTQVADRFEENIKGYFGLIEYDDMSAAYSDILEMEDLITKELEHVAN